LSIRVGGRTTGVPIAPRRIPPRAAAAVWLGVAASLLWLAAALLFGEASGVTTGDLVGTARDENGSAVAGVEITAANRETGLTRSSVSGVDGRFALRFLPPGSYAVTARRAGLQELRVEPVAVSIGTTEQLEIAMRVAPIAESVSVDGASGTVESVSTELAAAIGEREIRHLPINRRNYLDFALTTPGVTPDRGPQTGAATTSGLSVNGQDPRLNNVLLDGLDDNDAAVGAVRSAVTQEAVREYQVIRAPYSAEYGRAGGGVINVVTRSGSNDVHGTAFLFYRDESLSAENALSGTQTPYRQVQYGGALSGFVKRDRLFFFAAAERLDVRDANVVTIESQDVDLIRAAGFDVESGVLAFERDRTSVLAKLDASPTSFQSWALRGTWSSDTDENQQPWGGLVARSAGGIRDVRDAAIALTGISNLGTQASNEFRALYADRRHRLESLDATGGPAVEILDVATIGTQQFLPQPRDSRTLQAFDAVTFFAGPTMVKAGIDYLHTDLEGIFPLYFAGYYQFAPLEEVGLTAREAFAQGIPAVFVQGFGDPGSRVRTDLFAAFGQIEWSLSSRLLLRVGLRYEYENPADPFPADSNNWAPRLSFSWAPAETWRFRGGLGRFFAVAPIGPMFAVGIENGRSARILLRTILENPVEDVAAPWDLEGRRFGDESEAGAYAPAVFDAGLFRSAFTDIASVGVEKTLGPSLGLALDYVHARGRNILVEHNVNPIVPPGGRLNPDFTEIRRYESTGNSWYDGVTTSLDARWFSPFRLFASYTYADAESDYIDFSVGQPQDPLDLDGELGPTIHVPRHRATLAVVYSTPSTGPWWSRDWTLSAISDLSIGRPYNELAGFDRNSNGDPSSDRPEGVGHNRSTLPAYWNFDLRIGRRIRLGGVDLDLALDVFNLFNRTNVLEVDNVRYLSADLTPNPDFGTPTRVGDPTRLQFGLRLSF
jgi:hypothetical protein